MLDDDSKTLSELGVGEGETLEIKDLGPQICELSPLVLLSR